MCSLHDSVEGKAEVSDLTAGKSQHSINLMIATRDATIKRLEKELAEARAGGQPASQLRDAVLPVLEKIADLWVGDRADEAKALPLLKGLIGHLKTIPTLEAPSTKMVEKAGGLKPWKPLDHGPRDNDAAAPEYRR